MPDTGLGSISPITPYGTLFTSLFVLNLEDTDIQSHFNFFYVDGYSCLTQRFSVGIARTKYWCCAVKWMTYTDSLVCKADLAEHIGWDTAKHTSFLFHTMYAECGIGLIVSVPNAMRNALLQDTSAIDEDSGHHPHSHCFEIRTGDLQLWRPCP